jgi:hypothetical protein
VKTRRVCTSTLYTSRPAEGKGHEDGTAHLHEGQAVAARDGSNVGRAPEPRLVRCRERELDREAGSTGKAEAPPTPDAGPEDSAMLRRLDSTRRSALAWLDRTGQ